MNRKYIRTKIYSEINVIPFLDILLILLIIFMLIPIQFIKGFQINFNNDTKMNTITDNNKYLINIEILETGLYNFIFNGKKINNMNLDQLFSQISNNLYKSTNITCLISASKNTKYEEIIKVLARLSQIEIRSVGMVTYPIYLDT